MWATTRAVGCESGLASAAMTTSPNLGLASSDPLALANQTLQAWTDFYSAVVDVDLDAKTRVKRERARALIAKVGDWPESRQLPEILADARNGDLTLIDQDAIDARVIAAHAHDDRADLLAAVERARDSLATWVLEHNGGELAEVGKTAVGSPLGPLPVLTYVHAAAFQLAISGRDMAAAGAQVPDSLLLAGLRALVDTTGALAARMGIDTVFAVQTPLGSVVTVAQDGGWTVDEVESGEIDDGLPGLEGDAGILLDVAAGRRNPVTTLRGSGIKINQMQRLMKLAPIAKENPGLPGGPILRKSAPLIAAFGR